MIHKLYGDIIAYSKDDYIWYKFVGHYWYICDRKTYLKEIITIRFCNYLNSLTIGQSQIITKLIKLLKTNRLCNTLLNQITIVFTKPINFNTNHLLIPFKNGVYDFTIKQFRKGLSKDYINKFLNYDYDDTVEELELNIFPNSNIKDYTLQAFACALIGINKEAIYFINNSSLLLLMMKTFEYFSANIKQDIFIGDGNYCRDKIIYNDGKNLKLLICNDMNKNDFIDLDNLNILTNNEEILTDSTYCIHHIYVPKFSLFILYNNNLPRIHEMSYAIWKKIKVIKCNENIVEQNPMKIMKLLIRYALKSSIYK